MKALDDVAAEEIQEETIELPKTEEVTTTLGSLFKNIKLNYSDCSRCYNSIFQGFCSITDFTPITRKHKAAAVPDFSFPVQPPLLFYTGIAATK